MGLFGECHNLYHCFQLYKKCHSKGANISGKSFVGAIAGVGANISDCYSIENTICARRQVGGVMRKSDREIFPAATIAVQ